MVGEDSISKNRWLRKEIHAWENDGLIHADQAQQLLELYPQEEGLIGNLLPLLGALLLGVGVILFFAANWQAIPVWVKLTLIFGSLVSCQHFGYKCRFRSGPAWLGSVLLLLAGILFGAAIFLIAQIYHINAYFPNGIVAWSLGVLLMAWITREKPLLILGVVLLLIWTGSDWSQTWELQPWLHLILLFVLAFPLSYYLRSPVALQLCLVMLVVIVIATIAAPGEEVLLPVLVLLGSALFLRGLDPEERFAGLYSFTGLLLGLGSILLLSFYDYLYLMVVSPRSEQILSLYMVPLLIFAAISLLLLFAPRFHYMRREVLAVMVINGLVLTYLFMSRPFFHVLTGYIMLFLAAVAVIMQGTRLKSRLVLNTGLVFFYITVIKGYFDFGTLYIERSLFFIVGGILLILLGILMNRQKTIITSGWSDNHEA